MTDVDLILLAALHPREWRSLADLCPGRDTYWMGGTTAASMARLCKLGLAEADGHDYRRTGMGSVRLHNATRGRQRRPR